MTDNLFVEKLRSLAPTPDDYRMYNVSDQYIERALQRYNCMPRRHRNQRFITNDTILNLLQDYDCSKVEIAIVTFSESVTEATDYYNIGNAELDFLVISKITMEIEVRDHASPDHVMWPCASNSDNFLAALLQCVHFLTSKIKKPSLDDNQEYILESVEGCTETAGGKKYTDFYKMLLGYFG